MARARGEMKGTSSSLLLAAVLCSYWLHVAVAYTSYKYASGPFTVLYDAAGTPSLRVTRGNRTVWYTTTGNATFVTAARVDEEVEQNGGDFVFKTSVKDVCSDMKITSNGSRTGSNDYQQVYFRGMLCGLVEFEMWFQAELLDNATSLPTTHLLFNLSLLNSSNPYNQLRLTYGCEKDEQIYGFGAQYSKFNVKGQRLPLFLSEQGVGRGIEPLTLALNLASPGAGGSWYTTYTRVPHYLTSHLRSLVLQSLEYTVFDMQQDDAIVIEIQSHTLAGRIISGNSPLEIITSYTAYSGRMSALPKWVGQGATLGLQGGTQSVLDTLALVEKQWGNMSDVAAIWLQDWTGQRVFGDNSGQDLPRVGLWWNWEVDTAHYPNWTQLISHLNSKGIKTLTYINPLLSNISERGTPYQHNYYQEALDNGYAVKRQDGSVWTGYSNSVLADLSNPKTYQWMKDMIVKNMLATGVCGWMCDFGETVPLDARLYNDTDPHQYHSLYPEVWAQLNTDAVRDASQFKNSACNPNDVVYFMRSGNAQSPRSTRLFWLGDQTVTWDAHDGLGTVIIGMLTEGLSGYSLTHSDIGGYTAIDRFPLVYLRSKQLLMRWCELAAFTTMYRSHLGTLPTKNWQITNDTETLSHFFNMSIVFQSWDFYRRQLMGEAEEYGWPVARHMMLVYPNNSQVYTEDLRYQFMVGTELLIAPVHSRIESFFDEIPVFLPNNTSWVHLWSGATYTGSNNWVYIQAPLGQPCVLYPKGSKVGQQLVENLKNRKLL